ncbi:hypothetical protein [Natronomonas marina]|jgi:hypothetical protein|uniref:hypothetical protein n=1 Tax=Natronomonas marina TaxID=2961939 RepID=UPI0020C9FA63|nr:hypothetical protein [Natronomonas marina]
MSLQIGDAIGDGVRRAFTYSGGVLMALLFVYQLVFVGAVNTLVAESLPPEAQQGSLGLALPVPVAVAGALAVVGLLFGVVLYLVATRALTREHSELGSLPAELFTRRIGRATVSAVVTNIVVFVAVSVGFVFLFVPGIFLALSFVFVVFAIGVEDERAIDALGRSWELASGDRWSLLALGLIVGVVTAVGSGLGSVLSVVSPLAGQVTSLALASIFAVVSYGILADAYLQLSDAKPREPDAGSPTPEADPMA